MPRPPRAGGKGPGRAFQRSSGGDQGPQSPVRPVAIAGSSCGGAEPADRRLLAEGKHRSPFARAMIGISVPTDVGNPGDPSIVGTSSNTRADGRATRGVL